MYVVAHTEYHKLKGDDFETPISVVDGYATNKEQALKWVKQVREENKINKDVKYYAIADCRKLIFD